MGASLPVDSRIGLQAMRQLAERESAIIVLCSGGKESLAVLDLCHRTFTRVCVVFGYLVPDLSFQERTLRYLEQRYALTIWRMPYFGLSHFLADGTYRFSPRHNGVRKQRAQEWLAQIRAHLGVTWVASGERWADSLWRRAWLKRVAPHGLHAADHRLYPIIDWTKDEVLCYLERIGMPLPLDFQWFGHSFGRLTPRELAILKAKSPEDYAKVLTVFPLAETAVRREMLVHG